MPRVVDNSLTRNPSPAHGKPAGARSFNHSEATFERKGRQAEAPSAMAIGGAGSVPTGGGGEVARPLFTSVYLLDVDGTLETALSAAASFTIGPAGATPTPDVELVYNTGPDNFAWSAADFTAGRVNLRLFLPGYTGIVPYDSGAAAWSWDHSGTGDVMDTITVTKPAGAPIPADLGDFKSRIYLEIQQPG